jgi:poly-gamma-glutamate synthesis protein (capsule biosynthesis protein)
VSLKRRLVDEVRYEVTRWPLWRWDQNLRYLAKSVLHRRDPATAADADHWRASRAYLASKAWAPGPGDVTLGAVGDLMWLRDGYDRFLSDEVAALLGAPDLLLGNLETPIDPSRPVQRRVYETLHYNAPPEYLDAIARARAGRQTVLSLCNNHALDQGLAGLEATRRLTLEAGFACAGGPGGLEHAVASSAAGPLRVRSFALTFGVNQDEEHTPDGVPIVTFGDPRAPTDWDLVDRLVAQARSQPHDLVACLAHWGYEYEYWPDAAMRRDAHELVRRGVDVVVGASPHVLQPVEVVSVDGWDPGCPAQVGRGGAPRAALIAYSLGNFASIMPTVACQVGALLTSRWRPRDGAPPELTGVRAHPTVCMRALGDSWLDTRVVTLDEYTRSPRRDRPAARYAAHAHAALNPLHGA